MIDTWLKYVEQKISYAQVFLINEPVGHVHQVNLCKFLGELKRYPQCFKIVNYNLCDDPTRDKKKKKIRSGDSKKLNILLVTDQRKLLCNSDVNRALQHGKRINAHLVLVVVNQKELIDDEPRLIGISVETFPLSYSTKSTQTEPISDSVDTQTEFTDIELDDMANRIERDLLEVISCSAEDKRTDALKADLYDNIQRGNDYCDSQLGIKSDNKKSHYVKEENGGTRDSDNRLKSVEVTRHDERFVNFFCGEHLGNEIGFTMIEEEEEEEPEGN
jgi:hypothetical protein